MYSFPKINIKNFTTWKHPEAQATTKCFGIMLVVLSNYNLVVNPTYIAQAIFKSWKPIKYYTTTGLEISFNQLNVVKLIMIS